MSSTSVLPDNETLPLMVSVPMDAPGDNVPPEFTVTELLTVPVPPKVPPFTVTGLAMLPFTSNVPLLTVVAPV